ncbi:MAG: DUF3179 domain-containing protein [Planctomycetes bacterium]|nr:DUF3179 domain-containing protein [Planctomycetota bacterium]
MDDKTPVKTPTRTPVWQWILVIAALAFSTYQLVGGLADYSSGSGGWFRGNRPRRSWDMARKIRRTEDQQFLWALGSFNADDSSSQWFDMTDSPLTLESINHGIGRDTIPSIDHPLFVHPDDPRLRSRWGRDDHADISDLRVIGYESGGDARAYPVALLDNHELVNDTIGGKPVTVGW